MSRKALLRLLPGAADRQNRMAAEETFWAAVAGEPIRPEKLDPDLEVMARQIVRLGEAPLPDAAFAARLERKLLGPAWPFRLTPAISGAVPEAPPDSIRPSGRWARIGPRRILASFAATAALMAIVIASLIVTLRADMPVMPDRTMDARIIREGIGDEKLLLEAQFDRFPDGVLAAVVDRWVLQPGAEVIVGSRESGGEGASAYLVEAGTLTVRPDAPIAVSRAGSLPRVEAAESVEIALEPGDRGYAPTGVTALWRNDGSEPARVLEARIKRGDEAVLGEGVLHYTVISESPIARPEFPIIMSVYQVTLHPEAELEARTVPGLEMVKVERGRLVAVDVDDDGQLTRTTTLGQATRSLGSFPPSRVFRSGNGEPVSLLIVTISQDSPLAGTPRVTG